MKLFFSLRMRLLLLFVLTLIVPLIIITYIMPSYYNNLLTQDTTVLTESSLTSLTHNIETYLDELERLTVSPYWSEEVMSALKAKANGQYERADLYNRFLINKALYVTLPNFLKNPRKDILGTILLPYDGSVFVTSAYNFTGAVDDYPFTAQPWYQKAVEADGKISFISVHEQDYLKKPTPTSVFSVARLIKDTDNGQPLAVMMADADTVILDKIARDVKFNVSSMIAIFDDQQKLIYSTAPLTAELQRKVAAVGTNGQTVEDYVVVSKEVVPAHWNVVVLLSNAELKAKLAGMYLVGFMLAGIGIILTLLVFFTLSRGIIKPFKQMIQVMRKVQKGELEARVRIQGKDEIAELGAVLNKMIGQLNELIDSEYKAVLSKRNAEYRALQAQIQPHFLYNTLNGFIGLNRIGDRKLLEKSILSLSSMLRYILEHNDWTTVEEEIQFLRKYCELQQLRFQDKMALVIEIDPAAHAYRIPKLLLQPIVENAIIHGIEPMDRSCKLHIACRLERAGETDVQQSRLVITVTDDGTGFSQEHVDEKVDIGLANVRDRLLLAFHHARLDITSCKGEGTTVTMQIPLWEASQ
ncbi:cache domain-containing sensor histidine kinase [Paenibacillus rigui]|uniref:Two-component sensor histidine kinase n=1 Tax=Paenibacillus rigui TaxID=554312 RepID=A0A229UG73_9BACL|nr:sensor histidine kinase [Paenibacillus rigui]OXM82384.1 two-component sensor histidine kinase [Paenibacillus rigui]